jgi:hypothetical protein
VTAPVSAATIRRIEGAVGHLAQLSVARMDTELAWFRDLPPEERSWVTIVAQTGLSSFVEWLRTAPHVPGEVTDVFAAAPRALARVVSLQQTVELVRTTIAVAEANLLTLAGPEEAESVLTELLRYSREIAFAAAGVYASAAERRGAWDSRLEALVIDSLIRGTSVGDPLPSQLAALGWSGTGPIAAVVGAARAEDGDTGIASAEAHRIAGPLGLDAISAVHGSRLVIVIGGADDPLAAATQMLPLFADGPVVVSPLATDPADASTVTRAALSGLRAVAGWSGAPRPVSAADLLAERSLAGDAEARRQLLETTYEPLRAAGDVLLETLAAYLDSGGALEHTARTLFVHPNTVRYRLRRIADVAGYAPTDPHGGFVLKVALTLGRIDQVGSP